MKIIVSILLLFLFVSASVASEGNIAPPTDTHAWVRKPLAIIWFFIAAVGVVVYILEK
ncbi:MAG: hypothetical protein JKY42_11725 [Flavobacteriales bacterium]|nr:hypothetical protein [Flavobacteriales bacterium]